MMKLRHKKPLNPYKGQTNNDKNEFNDDDFRQQNSPLKKNGGPPNDQVYKYAKILSKFVKTINQDYRIMTGQEQQVQAQLSPERAISKNRGENISKRETVFSKKQQLREKKQMPKLQNKIQCEDDKKQFTLHSRKRENQSQATVNKQLRNSLNNSFSNSHLAQNVAQTLPKGQPENKIKDNYRAQKTEQNKPNPQLFTANRVSSTKANTNIPSTNPKTGQSANTPLNYQNFMNMPNPPANLQAMMNANQLPNNLNLMNMNGLNGLNSLQIAQLLMRNYNPNFFYGNVPMGMNMNNMPMMGMGNPNMQNNPAFMYPPNRNIPKPVPNLFSQQVKAFKTIETGSPPDLKVAYPLKRSAFHISISYKIYLDKLKQSGHSFQNVEEIDPTRNARRIKSNQQMQSKNVKQAAKKKK